MNEPDDGGYTSWSQGIYALLPVNYRTYCRCGHLRTWRDTNGLHSASVYESCNFRNCTNSVCPGCGRIDGGFGPVGCPCDARGSRGHGTRGEQPRPSVPVKCRRNHVRSA